jgi:hypothetical protein
MKKFAYWKDVVTLNYFHGENYQLIPHPSMHKYCRPNVDTHNAVTIFALPFSYGYTTKNFVVHMYHQ